MFGRKLRLLANRGVKNPCIRSRDEETRGVAVPVTLDFTGWRIRSVFGVATGPQRGLVQHATAIQVQDEDRCFRRDGVDFIQRGHTSFGELEFAPATDDADPLPGGCPLGLLLEHAQRVGEGRHAVPAKFEVVAEATADDMHVGVIQAGDDAATFEIDPLRVRPAFIAFGIIHANDAAIFDDEVGRLGIVGVERGDASVVENEVGNGL